MLGESRMSLTDRDGSCGEDGDSEMSDSMFEGGQKRRHPPDVGYGKILMLSCPALGLQTMWSLFMSYGTPYLRSNAIGLSTSLTALVWLAGPLCGALVQPVFGALSDRCQHPWGRRKPFILGGTVGVSFFLLLLASTPGMVNLFAGIDDETRDADSHHALASWFKKVLSVLCVYAINVAMQALQSGTRAILVDSCPPHRQAQASAWSSRFSMIGSVSIYVLGYTALPSLAPIAAIEFQALSVIAVMALIVTILPCILMHEEPLNIEYGEIGERATTTMIRGLRHNLRTLPPTTWKVCKVQFFAWLAWFPFLYYTTTFIYDTYVSSEHVDVQRSEVNIHDSNNDRLGQSAGILAAFAFAIVALITNFLLQFFAKHDSSDITPISQASGIRIFSLSLARIWQLSHLLFALCMFFTFFAFTVPIATILIAAVGVSWAIATWTPFALISTELSFLQARHLGIAYVELSASIVAEEGCTPKRLDGAAAILGIHNMAIALPQILAAVSCATLFKICEVLGVEDGAAWAFRAAGCASLIAAWMTRDLLP